MIIQTRYRDISFEEIGHACKHHTKADWDKLRGRPVTVEVPATPLSQMANRFCDGPYFRIVPEVLIDGLLLNVCPHIAEIGD